MCSPKISKIILAASKNTAPTKIQSAIDSPQKQRQTPLPAMAKKAPKSLARKPSIIASRRLPAKTTQEPQKRAANTQHTAGIRPVTAFIPINTSAINMPVIKTNPDIQLPPVFIIFSQSATDRRLVEEATALFAHYSLLQELGRIPPNVAEAVWIGRFDSL